MGALYYICKVLDGIYILYLDIDIDIDDIDIDIDTIQGGSGSFREF